MDDALAFVVGIIGFIVVLVLTDWLHYIVACKGKLHPKDCPADGILLGMTSAIWFFVYLDILHRVGYLP